MELKDFQKLVKINYLTRCCEDNSNCVKLEAVAKLPTKYGEFLILAFCELNTKKEHVVLMKGMPVGEEKVLVRLHSECLTGDALGSLKCDCGDQLRESMKMINKEGKGLILYLRQEGRGIGLINKIRAYSLQDMGLDTIDANLHLGFAPDERDYRVAVNILKFLKVNNIRLITNNPDKIKQLEAHGVKVHERIPIIVPPNEYNKEYLKVKALKAHHLIDLNIFNTNSNPSTPIEQENKIQ